MSNPRMLLVLCVMMGSLLAGSASSEGKTQTQTSKNEQALWNLEHIYWRYVQDNNLSAYLSLWHKDFLGWPSVSAAPVNKDHITDWITSQTIKGLTFQLVEFKAAAIQIIGDNAVTCYWITYKWLDKEGNGASHNVRVTHTWFKGGKDWKIIGGMSMPESAARQR
jgi:ketosteroid isomerase-like protein